MTDEKLDQILKQTLAPEISDREIRIRKRRILKKNSVYHVKSGVVLAAVLAGSLLVATTVYAIYTYGLRDLHLGKKTVLDLSKRDELHEEVSEKDIPQKEVDIIVLGGIAGSPEYSACNEWSAFLDGYDMDGAILSEIGNGFAGLGEYELFYNCHTQDMVEKVDEICEKYGLSRLQGQIIADDYDALCRQTNIGDIRIGVDGNVKWDFGGGYLYDDGTFGMNGRVACRATAGAERSGRRCLPSGPTFEPSKAKSKGFNYSQAVLKAGKRSETHPINHVLQYGLLLFS